MRIHHDGQKAQAHNTHTNALSKKTKKERQKKHGEKENSEAKKMPKEK
jgi:hypothetical protein